MHRFFSKSGDSLSPSSHSKDKKWRLSPWSSRPGSPADSSRGSSPIPSELAVAPHLPAAQSLPSILGPSDSPLPWKPFVLHAGVLQNLHAWNKNHTDTEDGRLPNVLRGVVEKVQQKVATTLDSKGIQIVLDAIPNGTVPVGNIIKGLVWLIILGLNIPERKDAAYNFAIQTAEHLNAMADAFGTSPPADELTQQCIQDLQPFCNAANELCEWAYEQITSKGALDNELQAKFKEKLDSATQAFLTISTIRTICAISGLNRDVDELLNYNERTARLANLKSKSKFGSCIATEYHYKDQEKQECHEATRASILEQLDSWIRDPSIGEHNRCWWMTGTAGVGKTAIAISTVQCLLDRQPLSAKKGNRIDSVDDAPILYGQYFCSAKLDTRKHHCLFPTLAIQIAETSPAAAHIIETALKEHPTLAHAFSLEQAKEIFLKPLCYLAKASPSIPLVIVIDGVDEFDSEPGETVYQDVTCVLGKVAAELPKNARLLILSRPEDHIIEHISSHTERHDLATKESVSDVRQYFNMALKELRVAGFPTNAQVDTLTRAADGHFGWARQALRWLVTELQWTHDATLDSKIWAITQYAKGDLDNLYLFILSRSLPPVGHDQRPSFTLQFQKLLQFLAVLRQPQPIHVIQELIQDETFDALKCLQHLSSIYASGTERVTRDTVPQPHKSFFDFITLRAVGEFHIEADTAHRELASSCFRIMREQLCFNMGGFDSPVLHNDDAPSKVAAHISYACSYFVHHVQSSGTPFVDEIHHWAKHLFLFWLEVLVLLHGGRLDKVRGILENFHPGVKLLTFVADTNIYEQLNSVTAIYTSAIPFASNVSPIAQHYRSQSSIHSRWNGENLSTWEECGQCISPDAKRVATSTQHRLSVSSVMGGAVIWSKQTSSWASNLFFSPDGQILACNDNGRIQLFDAASGNGIKPLNVGLEHSAQIRHAAISPQNDYIAVVIGAKVRIIRIEDGAMTWESKKSSTRCVWYLSDGRLANVYADERLVNGQTGESLDGFTFDKGIVGKQIYCISVSPDNSLLAVGPQVMHSCTISIWKTRSGQLVTTLEGHKNGILSTSFSSDGKLLVSGSADQTVRVWKCCTQTQTWSCIAVLYGHSQAVLSVAFLPDGKRIISTAEDWTIRIWDISAVLEGKEFEVHSEKGALVVDAWFCQGICLGGWRLGEPFLFQYPFKLPEGVQPLKWHIQSEPEDGGNDKGERASISDAA